MMKEFIEKLIKRLGENTMLVANSREFWNNPQNGEYVSEVIQKEKAIDIVNQLAEECGKDTNVRSNADRIRSMSNEELAEWLATIYHYLDDGESIVNFDGVHMHDSKEDILDWLQEEVEEQQ